MRQRRTRRRRERGLTAAALVTWMRRAKRVSGTGAHPPSCNCHIQCVHIPCCPRAPPTELKEENSFSLKQCRPIAVQRAPILACLTVPLKGVSNEARQPFKLPAGTTYTEASSALKKKKTFGARMNMCRCVGRWVTGVVGTCDYCCDFFLFVVTCALLAACGTAAIVMQSFSL